MIQGWRRPWLWLPASVSHRLSGVGLKLFSHLSTKTDPNWNSLEWRGLNFRNPLGIAGGVDKDAKHLHEWWGWGAGFIEFGTVTPRPQLANPGKNIDRTNNPPTLWNRLGFPSEGVDAVLRRLELISRPYPTPLFCNLGKNRDTPIEKAHHDYITVLQKIGERADGFVVNISSPNTLGLRDLFKKEYLENFLSSIVEANEKLQKPRPIFLKLSPDLAIADFDRAIETSIRMDFDGWIVSNTTLYRAPNSPFPTEGGVSGKPLSELAISCLKRLVSMVGQNNDEKLIISAGGILSPQDIEERLTMGADLVQVYTALVFHGPWFFEQSRKYFLSKAPKS